jgi:ribose-phosphate pyrophosphokinase
VEVQKMNNVKIFSGTSNLSLAANIASHLDKELGKVRISRFKSGEIYVHFEESVRNQDVFIIQTLGHPVILLMADRKKKMLLENRSRQR